MAHLQPKECRVSLSLDVSNMALPTEEERCPCSDRENMEVGSLAAPHQTGDCPCEQLTGTSLAFTTKKQLLQF